MIRILVLAGLAVAAGAAAIWRRYTSESAPATDWEGGSSSHSELGQSEPVQRVEGNKRRGIYAWYADRDGQSVLNMAGLKVRSDGLVYVGSATESFDYRIVRCHLQGTVRNHPRGVRGYGSTLRHSLAGVLFKTTGRASEQQVTHFMDAHLQVALKAMNASAESIHREESKLIQRYEPALNIKGLGSDNVESLRRMRHVVKQSVPALFDGEGG